MTLTSNQMGQMDVCIRCLGIVRKVLREVQVIRSGPIIRGPEISLYSTLVLDHM